MSDYPKLLTCVCCGYKTINKSKYRFETCYLCDWENSIAWSGNWNSPDKVDFVPNHDYTLEEAKHNFNKYYIMYRVANPEQYFSLFKDVIEAKKRVMMYLDIIEALEEHIELPIDSEYINLKFAILELKGAKEDTPCLINPNTGEIEKKD